MAAKHGTLLPPKEAQNYSAIATQLNADQLLEKYDFVNIQSGKTKITAATAKFNGSGGGASSTQIKANGTVSLFNAGTQSGGGTVSVTPTANGVKYFQTNGVDTTTATNVSLQGGVAKLGVKQTSSVSNKTLGNTLQNFSSTQWIVLGGVVAAGVLIYFAVR